MSFSFFILSFYFTIFLFLSVFFLSSITDRKEKILEYVCSSCNNIVIRDKELELSDDSGGTKVGRIIKEKNPLTIEDMESGI